MIYSATASRSVLSFWSHTIVHDDNRQEDLLPKRDPERPHQSAIAPTHRATPDVPTRMRLPRIPNHECTRRASKTRVQLLCTRQHQWPGHRHHVKPRLTTEDVSAARPSNANATAMHPPKPMAPPSAPRRASLDTPTRTVAPSVCCQQHPSSSNTLLTSASHPQSRSLVSRV